jgi:hypothetical protein
MQIFSLFTIESPPHIPESTILKKVRNERLHMEQWLIWRSRKTLFNQRKREGPKT